MVTMPVLMRDRSTDLSHQSINSVVAAGTRTPGALRRSPSAAPPGARISRRTSLGSGCGSTTSSAPARPPVAPPSDRVPFPLPRRAPPSPSRSAAPAQEILGSAISTSFLPSSCSRSRMRGSYSLTVVSSAKISGARSTKRRFQSPTEFGCTPYAFATWPGVLSPSSTSSTTCAFSFGEYLRLAIPTSFASARSYPEQRRSRRSTPQCWGVQDSGVISQTHLRVSGGALRPLRSCSTRVHRQPSARDTADGSDLLEVFRQEPA